MLFMAASASASDNPTRPKKYGVFLSFRGEDTRDSFVSHVHEALCQQGIITFIDNDLDRGAEISTSILEAIQESNISLVIFSKSYATSPWCLDELVQIMECTKKHEQKVLPVFYNVDPTVVENQTGCFGDAFAKHELVFEETKVRRWKSALKEATNLSGWDSTNIRPESQLIKEIVKTVLEKLRHVYPNDAKNLVGMKPRVEKVESLLGIGQVDVRIVGLWGMGGIGKTTLARVVFGKHSSHFEGSCFLANVREEAERRGLHQLQEEITAEVLNVGNPHSGTALNPLRHKRALLVLDDVDDYSQFECLIGSRDRFGNGSRIILTSRDKQVLQNVFDVDCMYEVQALMDHEALQLYNSFALKENLQERDHMELSRRVVSYAKGNSLALKVLGLFLRNKSKEEQESALAKLERYSNRDIQRMLRVSYDGLDSHDQQIFLYVACFFKWWPRSRVETILDACGFFTSVGLSNLADKSLITFSNYSSIEIHVLLQEMGREIVHQENFKEPGKRSRLWHHEDIRHVFAKNMGTEHVEAISLDMSKISSLSISPTAFDKMNRIKFLNLQDNMYDGSNRPQQHLPEGLASLPDELRYLRWEFYPLKSLPSNFRPENLVELDMSYSNVAQLWTGVQNLPKLEVIVLYECKQLVEMPYFSRAPNLKKIDFSGCTSLLEVSPSISYLNNLEYLILENCTNIRHVPSTTGLRSLKILNLNGCPVQVTSAIRNLSRLEKLKFTEYTNLGNCISSLGCLSSLRQLDLTDSFLESVPASIIQLLFLEELILTGCRRLRSLPQLPPRVLHIEASGCTLLHSVSSSRFTLADTNTVQDFLPGFFFINCPNLDQTARRNILNFMQQRLLFLASPICQYSKEVLRKQFKSLLMGNEIPAWIKDQQRGSTITIHLPPNWFNTNFLSFVMCIVTESNTELEYPVWWCRYICQFQCNYARSKRLYIGEIENVNMEDPASDHLFLWYNTCFHWTVNDNFDDWLADCNNYNQARFEFYATGPFPLNIKKCGVRPLYANDVKQCRISTLSLDG